MTFDETLGRQRHREPAIKIHGAEAFAAMHKAGRLTAAGLDMLGEHVKPGVTTQRLDDLAYQFAMDNGAFPAT
ncbi:MAG: type I methionyl aminopeptidase, partial [Bosea sp. (in: a-proteobacteria)]|nr:type I methionyl aminopeptidase [Bosea sp. (in: a-proteobacteria)]